MSLSVKEFKEQVERWQKAEPGVLASNFHQLVDEGGDDVNFQFVKARIFHLDGLDKLQKIEIDQMYIWMSLKEFFKDTVSFQPLLQVVDSKGKSHLFECIDQNLNLGQTEPIPTPFVENTTKLWLDQQSDQLPDMFTVTTDAGIQRVRFFKVEGTGLNLIKDMLPSAIAFNIIPGLDYNKVANSEDTLFIPIINVRVPDLSDCGIDNLHNGHLHGVGWSRLEDGDGDAFFDFNRPCPPLCEPPPPPPGGGE